MYTHISKQNYYNVKSASLEMVGCLMNDKWQRIWQEGVVGKSGCYCSI